MKAIHRRRCYAYWLIGNRKYDLKYYRNLLTIEQ